MDEIKWTWWCPVWWQVLFVFTLGMSVGQWIGEGQGVHGRLWWWRERRRQRQGNARTLFTIVEVPGGQAWLASDCLIYTENIKETMYANEANNVSQAALAAKESSSPSLHRTEPTHEPSR